MFLVLSPREHLAYGQDFLRRIAQEHFALCIHPKSEGGDYPPLPPGVKLVISHDPDDPEDARFITNLPADILVVAHAHLRWGYCSESQRKNLSSVFRRANAIVVPTEGLRSDLARRFPTATFHTVFNGVDPQQFAPTKLAGRETFRASHAIPKDARLCAYVGRLEAAKGTRILSVLARELAHSGAHLLIQFPVIGKQRSVESFARIAAHIRDIAPEHVHLAPDTNPRDIRPIGYCDVLVHPSLSEVAPLTVIESWMSGVPVVATNVTGFYREVRESLGDNAISLVEFSDPELLARTERAQLDIDDATSEAIASEFCIAIAGLPTLGDDNRAGLAARARKAGLSASDMAKKLMRIYRTTALSKSF